MVTTHSPSKSPGRLWVPFAVLFGGIILTLLLARGVVLFRQAGERAAFDIAVDRTRESLQREINRDLVLLDGVRGLADARLSVDRIQFQTYVNALQLRARYPAVEGLGFASIVLRGKKAESLANLRQNADPSFTIWPDSDAEYQCPVVYFEPADGDNTTAIGYDLTVDSERRRALEQGVRTAQPVVVTAFNTSGRSQTPDRSAVLIATPLYSRGVVPPSPEDRATKVFGFVFCVFRIHELLNSVSELGFEADFNAGQAPPEQLHLRRIATEGNEVRESSPAFAASSLLTVANRSWQVNFTGGEKPTGLSSYGFAPWWTLGGLTLTGVLFFLLSGQMKAKRSALHHLNAQRAAEARYQRLVEQSIVGIYVIQDDHFAYVNPRMSEILGYTVEELAARPLLDFIAEESRATTEGNIRRRISGEVDNVHYQLRAVRKDGQTVDLEAHGGRTEYNGRPAIMGSLIDITERKLAEKKAEAQLARLDLLSRITRAIAERQDLQSIFQVVVRSLEDDYPIDFGCVCLRDAAQEQLTVAALGAKGSGLLEIATPGSLVHIDLENNGLAGCAQGDVIYEPDIGDSGLPFLQRLAKTGLHSVVFSPIVVKETMFGVLVAARAERSGFSSPDCEFLRQLSEHIGLATHQAQMYAALQDAYDDLRETKEAAMQQERLRTIGQMASGIAHDINNAVTPVSVYTDLLLMDEPNLSARAREYLEIIQQSVSDVAATIGRLREVYHPRKAATVFAPVDMNKQIQQVVNLTRVRWHHLAQERGIVIKVFTKLAPELPPIMGVESEIREALTNLVINAVDAMPAGGELTLSSFTSTYESNPCVHIEVTDTGFGMDEETKTRCLEAFFTTKGDRGTGLGLAMVFGIMERHSAEIEIDSSPGSGTTFRLVFPVLAPPSTSQIGEANPQIAERLRILIIDDDPVLLKSLQIVLESDGHSVVAIQGGRAGVEAFLAAHTRNEGFSVVITDLGMPDVDGREVLRTVKKVAASTPVFILTGWGKRLEENGDIPSAADCVLSKPPRLHELRAALLGCVSHPSNLDRTTVGRSSAGI